MATLQQIAYQAPARLARAPQLRRIAEERDIVRSDSEGEQSDDTVRARPRVHVQNIDAVLEFIQGAKQAQAAPAPAHATATIDIYHCQSPTVSDYYGRAPSVADSDVGTVFSEEECPSLDSEPTTFRTLSSRSSVVSGRSAANQYSTMYLPQDAWRNPEPFVKEAPVDMYLAPQAPRRHQLSTDNLATLSRSYSVSKPKWQPRCAPALEQQDFALDRGIEIVLDEDVTEIFTPGQASEFPTEIHSAAMPPQEWTDMVYDFPHVPGATPLATTPFMPTFAEVSSHEPTGLDDGVFLSLAALQTLAKLTTADTPLSSPHSTESVIQPEMQMRQKPATLPKQLTVMMDREEIGSNESLSPLSIPSPGHFFASLKQGSCSWGTQEEQPEVKSAEAQHFYDLPWARDEPVSQEAVIEDEDMYGSGGESAPPKPKAKQAVGHEYEETYEMELRQAVVASLDRTSSWLTYQNTYLSSLVEERAHDPNDCPPTPFNEVDEAYCQSALEASKEKIGTQSDNVVGTTVPPPTTATSTEKVTTESKIPSSVQPQEAILNDAFEYLTAVAGSADAHAFARARLQALQAERLAAPEKYIDCLTGRHDVQTPKRPKYAGPHSQNPRNPENVTGEAEVYKTAERQQAALASIQASNWQIEALRSLFNGRLFASRAAHRYLKRSIKFQKTVRVLDLGGKACASWGWHAAQEFPSAKIVTVISKDQAAVQHHSETTTCGPSNHRNTTVPALWKLPFRDNRFDVISVRNLHALLKSNPVPNAPSVNEWDMTLRECQRVLKPNGFLDFMVMDSSVANAGPKSEAMSTEFGFDLIRRGYEKDAARSWLPRLDKTGFANVQRSWVVLPMGKNSLHSAAPASQAFMPAPRPISEVSCISHILGQYMDVEAIQGPIGSTQGVADLTGLIGARMWEEWIAKIRSENGRSKATLLQGLDAVLEEGKEMGSGWKVLVGCARKPRPVQPTPKLHCPTTFFVPAEGCMGSSPIDSPADGFTLPFMLDHASLMGQVAEYQAQYEQTILLA